MISYGKQKIDENDIQAVVDTLKSDWLTQGPAVKMFENNLAKFFGASHCYAVSNGTAALHLSGLALDWSPNDYIITSPITFLATANSILYSGATPIFIDIDPITYTIDILKLEKKIKSLTNNKKKIKAVIGVDFAGHPCDWESLLKLSKKYNFKLINDNCHAMGASYKNNKKYAIKYADIVTQSYHPVKHLTTGEGGAIFTKSKKIASKISALRSHGMTKTADLTRDNGQWYYEMNNLGYNYRITDFQCALGSSQLKKLNKFVERRREIAVLYDNYFSGNKQFITPKVLNHVDHAYHLYPLQIDFKNIVISKKSFFKEMYSKGISLQVHYIPVNTQPYYKKNFGYDKKEFINSSNFYNNEVSLPIYPDLKNSDIKFIAEAILSSTK